MTSLTKRVTRLCFTGLLQLCRPLRNAAPDEAALPYGSIPRAWPSAAAARDGGARGCDVLPAGPASQHRVWQAVRCEVAFLCHVSTVSKCRCRGASRDLWSLLRPLACGTEGGFSREDSYFAQTQEKGLSWGGFCVHLAFPPRCRITLLLLPLVWFGSRACF